MPYILYSIFYIRDYNTMKNNCTHDFHTTFPVKYLTRDSLLHGKRTYRFTG
jgi:hypothetical protein